MLLLKFARNDRHYKRGVEEIALHREDTFPDFPLQHLVFLIFHLSASGAKQLIDHIRANPSATNVIADTPIYREYKLFFHDWQLCCKHLEGSLQALIIFQYSEKLIAQFSGPEICSSISTDLRGRVLNERLEKQYSTYNDRLKHQYAAKATPVNTRALCDACVGGALYEGLRHSKRREGEIVAMPDITEAGTLWCPKSEIEDFRLSIVVSSHCGKDVAEARRRSVEELKKPLGESLFASMNRSKCRSLEKTSSKKGSDAVQATVMLSGDYIIDVVLDSSLGMSLVRQL